MYTRGREGSECSEIPAHASRSAAARSPSYRTCVCQYTGPITPYVACARCGVQTCGKCHRKDCSRCLRLYRPFVTGRQEHQRQPVTLTLKETDLLEGTVDYVRQAWKTLLRQRPYRCGRDTEGISFWNTSASPRQTSLRRVKDNGELSFVSLPHKLNFQ
jgi:hypothetical protein